MEQLEDIIRKNCSAMEPLPTQTEPKLNKLPGVKAVLFDVYGTLIISGSGDVGTASAIDKAEAITQSLVVAGFEGNLEQAGRIGQDLIRSEILAWHQAGHDAGVDFPEVEIIKVWMKVVDILRNTETLRRKEYSIDQIRRLALHYECRINPVYPMPGCFDLLSDVQRRNLPMGIVSNAQFYTPLVFSAFFEKTVAELGFDQACCVWSYKELKAKPSAHLFPKAGKYLEQNHGIALSDAVYVGNDMLNDVFTAKQAGCKTVLFAGDQRSLRLREDDERCRNLHPDAVVTSLDQILEII